MENLVKYALMIMAFLSFAELTLQRQWRLYSKGSFADYAGTISVASGLFKVRGPQVFLINDRVYILSERSASPLF